MVRVTTQWLAIGSVCRILGVGVMNSQVAHWARDAYARKVVRRMRREYFAVLRQESRVAPQPVQSGLG